ncbi:MAG: class II fructose-bisphosphate aldolase, partial [Deltaproteobacteria bacterium]
GLNAHSIFPDWIALNNGTTHGIEASDQGIQVPLTAAIHEALQTYGVSGAQHGTSGNSSEKLREIVSETNTTKANVATALQMISWGLEVNDYGNAILDENGNFKKVQGKGVTEEIWGEIVAYAESKGYKVGDYKNLNLYFDTRLQSQPSEIRERMVQGVEDFAYSMIVNVLNSKDTAPLAVDAILKAGSFDLGPKASSIEDPAEWTESRIIERAKGLDTNKGPSGNFDD